jgi:Tol biopolymer transport system component
MCTWSADGAQPRREGSASRASAWPARESEKGSRAGYRRLRFGVAVLVAAAVVMCASADAGPSATPSAFWVTDGVVKATALSGSTLYLGGSFGYVGPDTGSFAALDAASGQPSSSYPVVDGDVRASAPDGSGGWFIGGAFTSVGGVKRDNLAHILGDGSLDPAWDPDSDGPVDALAVSGSTVYVGGAFTNIGGQSRSRIAALDATTGNATSWDPSADNTVRALAVSGSTVFAGGQFTSVGGQPRASIAALDVASGAATSWNPGADGTVLALAVSGSTVYAAGSFGSVGGQARARIAAIDATSGNVTSWEPDANDDVEALAVSGSTVYAGGTFTTIGGQSRADIAALDSTTGAATAWNPGADGGVDTLAVSGTTVYAGGAFGNIGGQSRLRIAALDAGTGNATSWNPTADGSVLTLDVSDSNVYAGGQFNSAGGVVRSNAAAIDTTTGSATNWNPSPDGAVLALAVSGSTVYAGGQFASIGGQARARIAALEASTGTASSWEPDANDYVSALAVSGAVVYAGGSFTMIGGQERNRIAAIDTTTGDATAWDPGADAPVAALAASGPIVYAGGAFTTIGGQARNRLAALDPTTGDATSWNPSPDADVDAMAVTSIAVYVGGGFTTIGGQSRSSLAAIDPTTGEATSWNPSANGEVDSLATSGSIVYAGGSFTAIGGQSRGGLAAIDAASGSPNAWSPNADGAVLGLSAAGVAVYAGGSFVSIGGQPRQGIAAFSGVADVPGPPTAVTAVAGNAEATVAFAAPASDGGAAVTSYTVTASPGGATATGAGRPITVTGLTNGANYTFTVVATNIVGTGSPSAPSNSVTPATGPPGAPTAVTAVPGNAEATVQFTPPEDDGAAITSYTVTASPGGATATGAGSPITVTGLTNGTSYTFTVTATNANGTSGSSAPSSSVVPAGPPGAPTAVTAVAGKGRATVQFTPPDDDGGAAITSYSVTASPGGASATGAGSPIAITGLTNGTSYTFRVTATNSAGTGPASAASSSVTPIGVPGAPTGLSAIPGSAEAAVQFTAPSDQGGSAITSYTITAAPGGATGTGAGSPITVTGLTNGTSYTFTVTATNGAGTGPASASSNAVVPIAGPTSSPTASFWVTNGTVDAETISGSTLYLGGSFSYVGPQTGGFVDLDPTGAVNPDWPEVNGQVYSTAPDGSGGWYIGGAFTSVGGVTRHDIAHITSDGSLDTTWDPDANGSVYALAASESTVYAGGQFTTIGGQNRNEIAALDAVTGAATVWDPNADSTVLTLAVGDSAVYAGGAFTTIGGQSRDYVAALDPVTGNATSWNPDADGSVGTLTLSGSVLYAGGSFATIGGQSRSHIAALDLTTGLATSWNPDAGGLVSALAVSGTTVYAGGSFTTIGGQARNRIAALDAQTGAATSWNPGSNGPVYALALSGATVYAGGYFTTIGGQARNDLAAIDAASGTATSWNPSAGFAVFTLGVSGSSIFAGGPFDSVGGVTRDNIAAIDTTTGAATSWDPNANGQVLALAVSGSTVYVGGSFIAIGGQPRDEIGAVDTTTGLATNWDPTANGSVDALVVSGSVVYAGGTFTTIGGQSRNRIAAIDIISGAATAWNPDADQVVQALAVSGSTVYAGGAFQTIGGEPRSAIAAIDVATGDATGWNPDANSNVSELVVSGSTVYAGGIFTSIGGQLRFDIAALDAATGAATTWNPDANGPVLGLALAGSRIYAAGAFSTIGGQPRNGIAALDTTSSVATTWNPDANFMVRPVAVSGSVYVGGDFSSIGGSPAQNIARFASASTVPETPTGVSATAADGQATVAFSAADGGSPITSYTVTSSPGTITATGSSNVITVPGLTDGTTYTFTVTATNSIGTSDASDASNAVTPTAVPGAPTAVSATPGNGQAVVSFAPAAATSGGGTTSFVVTASPGGITAFGTASPITIAGLQNGTIYTFSVTGRNASGTSPPSAASNAVAPAGGPTADTPNDPFWVTNGAVDATALSGTTLFIGGAFNYLGPSTGGFVVLDGSSGAVDPMWPKVNGTVDAAVPDGSGGWYIGGNFCSVGTDGVAYEGLAHLSGSGAVDTTFHPLVVNSGACGTVDTLVLAGSTLYVGGTFTAVGGTPRSDIAAINLTTDPFTNGQATSWNPGANGSVNALALSGSTLYAGGNFTTIGGQSRNRIAAIDIGSGAATAWNPNASQIVQALAVSGTTVYAGGAFTAIGGQPRNAIAALDATTGNATAWNPNANSNVSALAVSGSTVYAGGIFGSIGGQSRFDIAALDATSGAATSWNPGANGSVNALAVSGSTVYAGGAFTTIGGQTRSRLAALDATSGLAAAWNPSAGNTVLALGVLGSTVYAGGVFNSVGGVVRSGVAALNTTSGAATAWNPNVLGVVDALAVSGSTVYAGGSFVNSGGQVRTRLAALDAVTGATLAWNPSANGTVDTLVVSGGSVYAGGSFTTIGGQSRDDIAALDPVTGLVTAWNPSANGPVNALAVSGTSVYAGGSFTSIGGQARNDVAALDPGTGLATAWNPNVNGPVNALAVSGSTVYAGGSFVNSGGQVRNRLAALDASTGATTAWNPNANGPVDALAVSGSTVVAGGAFGLIGGETRNNIAALDADTGDATTWNPNMSSTVSALASSGSTVYAGGQFSFVAANTTTLSFNQSGAPFRTRQGIAQLPEAQVPAPPGSVTAVAGDSQATVVFTPPASNGGSSISWYTVSSSPGGFSATGPASPLVIEGLTNGVSYTFTVTATNSAGTSVASSPSSAVTATALAPPLIAFGRNKQIYVMNADGSAQTRLTNGEADTFPALSPDGTKIAFTRVVAGVSQIFVMNVDGSDQTPLTNAAKSEVEPTWSPDGSKIAFQNVGDGHIWVMNADGSDQTELTNDTGIDIEPAWSPDGSKIAFASSRDGNDEIYVMNADGSNPMRLTNNTEFDGTPAWSPDGHKIAFASERDGGVGSAEEIYVMNADGSDQTRLTFNTAADVDPTWSPDGTQIAWACNPSASATAASICVMSADGSGQTQMPNFGLTDAQPNWQHAAPGAPTSVTASPGDGSASVSFDAPALDGGLAVTLYTVTASPGDRVATGSSSPIAVDGLTNGTSYTFAVTATNGAGTGAPSAESSGVTPLAVPGVPRVVFVSPGDGSASVSFSTPPSDGGTPITSYTVTSSPGGLTGTGSSSPIAVGGLTNGASYAFAVAATNATGTGPASAPSEAVTPEQATTPVDCSADPANALQKAIAAASDGDTLAISGTCTGSFEIPGGFTNKGLTLRGATPTATLGGGADGTSVVTIDSGAVARIDTLTISGGGTGSAATNSCSAANGEGIDNAGTLTLVDANVTNNVAGNCFGHDDSGGGIFNNGTATIMTSTVSGNFAGGDGGGVDNSGTMSIVDTTVSGNGAGEHAGVANSGTLTVSYSTVSGNTLDGATGGLFTDPGAGGASTTLTAAIVAGNGADDCAGAGYVSGGYDLIGNADTTASPDGCRTALAGDPSNQLGTTATPIEPLLGALGDNGGPTPTRLPGAGSPALDAVPGGSAGCGTTVAADQRGFSRPQPANGACDIGAVEATTTTATVSLKPDVPSAEAGMASIDPETLPVDSIPLELLAQAMAPLAQVGLQGSPIQSVPLSQIGQAAPAGALTGVLLSQLPLLGQSWSGLLAGTDLAGEPLQSVTYGQALDANPTGVGSIPLSQIDLHASPLGQVGLAALILGELPLSQIPLNQVSPGTDALPAWCAALAGPPVNCSDPGTLAGQTLVSIAIEGAPLSQIPLSQIPLSQIPLSQIPLSQIPLSQIDLAASPLSQIPLSQIPLSQIDLFVDCTKIDCTAPSETIGDAAAAGAVEAGQTYPDLVQALPLSQITIDASPLSQIPLSQIPLSQIGQFVDCSKVDCTTATFSAAAHAGAIKPGNTYDDLLQALPLSQIPLLQVPLNEVPLSQIPLSQVNIVRSPLSQIPLSQIPLNQIPGLVDCSKVDCTSATLGDAANAGAIQSGASLADLVPFLPNDFTLGQMLLALVNPDTFPWEQLPYASMDTQSIANGGTLPFTLRFTLTGPAATSPADVSVTMPPGAVYTPGSASLGPAGGAGKPLADPVVKGAELDWSLPTVNTGETYALHFTLYPGVTVGATQATATVNSVVAAPVSVEITEPNGDNTTPGTALDLQPGLVYFGYVAQPGEAHYYRVPAQTPGSQVTVRLANVTADSAISGNDDLVVYSQAGFGQSDSPQLKAAGLIADNALPAQDDPSVTAQEATAPGQQIDGATILGSSADSAGVPESVSLTSTSAEGSYLIQVGGFNQQTSNLPYTLRIEVDPPAGQPAPVPRVFPHAGEGTAGTLPTTFDKYLNTLFLVDAQRIGDTYGAAAESNVMDALNALASRTDLGVNGAVVPVEGDPTVAAAYKAWDADPYSPDLANGVVRAIGALIDGIHATHPYLKYLVIVGSDDIIPMARIPDGTQSTNEQGYASTFAATPNEYYGAFANRDVLSDQPYATTDPVSLGSTGAGVVYVPDLAVGRLVETPDQIVGALTQFETYHGTLDPTTALTTGYDFLGPGASQIASTFDGLLGASRTSSLLTETWTHSDLLDQLFPSDGVARPGVSPGIVSLNAHADQSNFLPAEGNATQTDNDLFSVSELSTLPPDGLAGSTGAIWFSMGCHAGLNVSDTIVGAKLGADWPQTLAGEQGVVYLANTGFGLGDSTGAPAYSVRLMDLFATHLDGSVSVGEAWVEAVRDYYDSLGRVSVADEKAMEEGTLYGLPFFQIGHAPAAVPLGGAGGDQATPASSQPASGSPLLVDPLGGLESQQFSFSPNQTLVSTPNGSYYEGDAGTMVVPYEPVVPLSTLDFTVPGQSAHGIVLTSTPSAPLVSTDVPDFTAAFSRPVIDSSASEPAGTYANVSFPSSIATLRSLGTVDLPDQTGVFATGQFLGGATPGIGVMRLWKTISGEVLYSPSTDYIPPTISSTDAVADGSDVAFTVHTSDPGAQVQFVYVLYRDAGGTWQPATLTQGTGDAWTGTAPASSTSVEYFVEAADTDGNVAVSPNAFSHGVDSVALSGTSNAAGAYTGPVQVSVSSTTGSPLQYSLDGGSAVSYDGTFTVAINGFHTVDVSSDDGAETSESFTIASQAPLITLTTPGADAQYPLGSTVDALYACTDRGSGVSSCTGTNASGTPIDTSTLGKKTFSVTATNSVGLSTTTTVTYTITAPAPTLALPADRTVEATGPAGAPVTYNVSASDPLDGTDPVTCTPSSGSTFGFGQTTVVCSTTNAHEITTQGSFRITVVDTTAPSFSGVPADVTAEATGPTGSTVTYAPPTATDLVDGARPVQCAPPSGSTFPVGRTTVNCVASDLSGNTAMAVFHVTVQDTTPPVLTLPHDLSVEATGPLGAAVTFTATALDAVDGSVAVVCNHNSGDTFPVGQTTVRCSATDSHANTGTGSFTVTVDLAPAITSANNATFTTGTAGMFTVKTTGFPTSMIGNVSFTGCTKSTLPSGVTFVDNSDGTATLSGTPAAATGGTYTLCLNAANGVSPNATQPFALTVNQAPAITSANNAMFMTGSAGSFTVKTTGFPASMIRNVSFTGCTKSVTLPSGMKFVDNNDGTATLSGTPATGTNTVYTLCLNASNGVGSTATQAFTLTVATLLGSGTTSCNGVYSGSGSQVAVPAAGVCTLLPGTKVSGNLQVNQGAELNDQGAAISGNLQATNAVWIEVGGGGSIGGNLSVQGLTGSPAGSDDSLCNTKVGGNVALTNNGAKAPVDIGNLGACSGGPGLTVGGNLQVQGNAAPVRIGGNTATGSLQVQNNASTVTVTGNMAKGNIQVQSNTGGGTLTGNTTSEACQLQSNNPKIVGSGNTATGQDTCNGTA